MKTPRTYTVTTPKGTSTCNSKTVSKVRGTVYKKYPGQATVKLANPRKNSVKGKKLQQCNNLPKLNRRP